MWLVACLLLVVIVQLWWIGGLLRHQTGMIQAASDLNLEAHQRQLIAAATAERHLSEMPKMRQPGDP